ncbi:MAG: toll/interleukin-1 receptor domain-containing protein [Chloroflexota bacterium]|nr:toll/interleukin-1 receptor domain-containing protein [Chloroflexota bacterium]
MPKVFISHSNQDSDETLFVADALRRAGIDVWVDFENIRGGADWLCEIQAGIQRCDAIVVVLSQASAGSVWVERECLYAWQLRKPVFTALVADILIPLHLINIQYCDLRQRPADGMGELVTSILSALQLDGGARQHAPAAVSRQPIEANFFPYLEQLPDGDIATLVARELFHWSRAVAGEVAFSGLNRPGFQARIKLGRKLVTVFSLRAYRRQPSAQIPLDTLAACKPFKGKRARKSILRALNQLLPRAQRFKADKADRRPTLALHHLSSAEKLEAFKAIVLDIISELRAHADAE